MSSEEQRLNDFNLTDPKTMRALAHPVRMRLLELLREYDTLTATQAAELMGETPANCAFHLRTLAKYGFVQEAGGGRGRERPWRNATRTIQIESGQLDPQAAIAANALSAMWHERWFEHVRQAFAAPLTDPWDGSRTATLSRRYLTADELDEIAKDVTAALSRYSDRDDADRPDDAQLVELMFFGFPIAEQPLTREQLMDRQLMDRPLIEQPPAGQEPAS
jgi:predicted transcriptional regulator